MITRMDFVRRLLTGVAVVSLVTLPSVAGEGNNAGNGKGKGGGNGKGKGGGNGKGKGGGHHGGGSDPDPGPGGSGGHVE